MMAAALGRPIHGFHPIREALRHRPQSVVQVLSSAKPGKRRAEIAGLCRRYQIELVDAPATEVERLAKGGRHNGFIAYVADHDAGSEGRAKRGGDPDFKLLVEDIQDPRNLGALLRVCESAGISQVMVRDRGSAPLSAVAVKASAGAAEWLDVERVTNSAQEIERLQADGFWVYGAAAGGLPPWQIDLTGKVLLCLGGEASGLRARTRGLCDELVGLPMLGRVESLNLATAASALLYDAVRQRS